MSFHQINENKYWIEKGLFRHFLWQLNYETTEGAQGLIEKKQ
jgi:hypothetical protein